MAAIYTNSKAGTITDAPLSAVATTINSTGFANLPAVSAPDFLWITLDPRGVESGPELVKVTAHTASATSITVTRAQQSTSAVEHPSGTEWISGLTKDDADKLPHRVATTQGDILFASAANTIDRLGIGTEGLALVSTSGVPAWTQVDTDGIADAAVTLDKLATEVINRLVPAGTVRATIASAADDGWVLHDQTIVDCETLYPDLWAAAPAGWKTGSDLDIPDLTDLVLSGAGTTTLGEIGGVVGDSITLTDANMPTHDHSINHDHASVTSGGQSATHSHDMTHDHPQTALDSSIYDIVVQGAYNGSALAVAVEGTALSAFNFDPSSFTVNVPNFSGSTGNASGDHTHSVDLPNYTGTSGTAGSDEAFSVRNRHLAVTYQIKAH
jgi:microcystin-dependent protein